MNPSENYKRTRTPDRLEIRFATSLDAIDRVCREVRRFLVDAGHETASDLFAVDLVLREGLTNAVRHGNSHDRTKDVICRVSLEEDRQVRMDIEDQGPGFDWKKRRDRLPDDTDEHGRGLLIMKTYVSEFWFNDQGNRLTLIRKQPFLPSPQQQTTGNSPVT